MDSPIAPHFDDGSIYLLDTVVEFNGQKPWQSSENKKKVCKSKSADMLYQAQEDHVDCLKHISASRSYKLVFVVMLREFCGL